LILVLVIFEEIELILITQMFELIHFEIDFIIVEVEIEQITICDQGLLIQKDDV
jgi:hypothetical protein